jgi:hypothetical protein
VAGWTGVTPMFDLPSVTKTTVFKTPGRDSTSIS